MSATAKVPANHSRLAKSVVHVLEASSEEFVLENGGVGVVGCAAALVGITLSLRLPIRSKIAPPSKIDMSPSVNHPAESRDNRSISRSTE